ncbi:MAG: DUF3089 domain-containing protein [Bacteroidales bacterium]|nr:DUF3089 domain-containing protein [Bacteroidales bacterium]
MNIFNGLCRVWVGIVACLLAAACQTGKGEVPPEPDYSEERQWYAVDRGAEADVLYITSTATGDYEVDGQTMHHADVSIEAIRTSMQDEMRKVDQLLSGGLNFYSPFYRQCTMESYTNDSLLATRAPLAMGDVRRAFEHYIKHLNGGRRYVLAGFSQGGQAVVELLRTMDAEAHSRMAAAYVIGWKVSDDDMAAARVPIVAAQDSTDVGVTICYNSVRSPECGIPIITESNRLAINPLNWRTDATPATLVFRGDTLRVAVDTASKLLVVEGYTGDYMLPLIGREGNYHRMDLSFYAESLRRNIALRISQ